MAENVLKRALPKDFLRKIKNLALGDFSGTQKFSEKIKMIDIYFWPYIVRNISKRALLKEFLQKSLSGKIKQF